MEFSLAANSNVLVLGQAYSRAVATHEADGRLATVKQNFARRVASVLALEEDVATPYANRHSIAA
jgi:hypothetical protein